MFLRQDVKSEVGVPWGKGARVVVDVEVVLNVTTKSCLLIRSNFSFSYVRMKGL